MPRNRVFSLVSQLASFRDSRSRTSSLASSASPPSSSPEASSISSAATSLSSRPPTSSPSVALHDGKAVLSIKTSQHPPAASLTPSPASATEPFPEIHPSHFPVYTPPTPPNDSDLEYSGSSSPIEPIPEEDGLTPLVNVKRSNSGQRASRDVDATTTATAAFERRRSYSVASNYSGRERSSSRPASIVQTYQAPQMDISEDTPPELQPTFTFLNNHGSKLYQEGYFLKLDDQNAQGRPNADRTWHECFAQLVGTVLSLWDAAELDAAGDEGEVLPKFINITDASIKMIESIKMSTDDSQELQNILSVSTAGRNRYLLHFNSHHSLMQWTSAIRLAMFEHSSLQEAYTGALIAGKARNLNNINIIMDRAVVPTEDWVRVRFGAGMPWRRCWCVVTPPSLKELGKAQKEMKKRSPYSRPSGPMLKGDIKFYDTRVEGRKLKKAKPIVTISDSYAAYAIYPQAKPLIDASTLVKIEGDIVIHSDLPSASEGFVFMMPEVHPAVSGFETLLRFLFPIWDTFGLYGRPGKLVASPLDTRALMFAMPRHKSYGYLEILDVSGLVSTAGCDGWSDREWRKRLKELTGQRRSLLNESGGGNESSFPPSVTGSRRSVRTSTGTGALPPPPRLRVGFSDANPVNRSSRSFSLSTPTAPRLGADSSSSSRGLGDGITSKHARNSSDPEAASSGMSSKRADTTPQAFTGFDWPQRGPTPVQAQSHLRRRVDTNASENLSSDDERSAPSNPAGPALQPLPKFEAPGPVARPPRLTHDPSSRPLSIMHHSPETRRNNNNRLSLTTLSQLAKAGRVAINMDLAPDASASGSMRAQGSDANNAGRQNLGTGRPPYDGPPAALAGAEPFPALQNDFLGDPNNAPPPVPFARGPRAQSPSRGPQAAPPGVPASMRPGPPRVMSPPMQVGSPPGRGGGFTPPPPQSPGMRGFPPPRAPGGCGQPPPPFTGMRLRQESLPPGPVHPMHPQFRNGPPQGVSGPGPGPGPGGHLAHRPNPTAVALPQRTTSLQNSQGKVARSATADAAGIDRGRAHRQDSDLSGSNNRYGEHGQYWPRLERPGTGSGSLYSEPDVVDSPTGYIVSHLEREQRWRQQQQQQQQQQHPGSRSQSPAPMSSGQPPRPFSPTTQSPRGIERWMTPQPLASPSPGLPNVRGAPWSPEYHAQQRVRAGSPGPGRAMTTDPRIPGGPLSPRAPASLSRSASYDVMNQQPLRPFAPPEIPRPGSSASMRSGGAADHAMRGTGSPLVKLAGDGSMVQGLGLIEHGGAQRAPATIFHQHAQPQRPVIVDPSTSPAQTARIQMSPLPPAHPNTSSMLHPDAFSGPPMQSPHRSPVMGSSPKLATPMSATFGHAGPGGMPSPPMVARGPSPRPQGRPVPPPQGQYTVPSKPGTPQLGPQYHGQAF